MTDGDEAAAWGSRALAAWLALAERTRTPTPRGARIHEPGGLRVVFAWPLSQVLHACILLECATGRPSPILGATDVWDSLRRYRRGDGFADTPIGGRRYYDDNAWIGLACAQGALVEPGSGRWLARAEASLRFVSRAVRPGGGVPWVEGGDQRHACSTGSVGLLAAATDRASGGAAWRHLAGDATRFLRRELQRDDGLIADNISPTGVVDPAVFTYNQGLAIQLRLYDGDVDGAVALARATEREFDQQRYDAHPACFNAIHGRALLHLAHETGDEHWRRLTAEYLHRCWDHGRDRRGLFTGVGRYDKGVVLDHAGLVGLMAAFALPPGRRGLIV